MAQEVYIQVQVRDLPAVKRLISALKAIANEEVDDPQHEAASALDDAIALLEEHRG